MNVVHEKGTREHSVVLFGTSAFFVHVCPLDFIIPFIPMLQKVMACIYTHHQNIAEG